MGKGDKKTRRGKIWNGSFGARRPRKQNKTGTKSSENKKAAGKKS